MLNWSRFPFRKTNEDFYFPFQPSLKRSIVDEPLTLKFIHNVENAVFLGPQGIGRIHLSIALGTRSIMSDIPFYYTSAMKMAQTMKFDYDLKRVDYRIKAYSRYRLKIVDEI